MRPTDRCVVLFRSVHDVMAMDRELTRQELWHDLIPVPRSLSVDCGLAVELRISDLEGILDILHRIGGGEERVFRLVNDRYTPWAP